MTVQAPRTIADAECGGSKADILGRIPVGRFVEVDEIARMVAFLRSADCSFSTGAIFDLFGGRATY